MCDKGLSERGKNSHHIIIGIIFLKVGLQITIAIDIILLWVYDFFDYIDKIFFSDVLSSPKSALP